MMHVTNGDLAAEAIARAGMPGAVIPWRDVLHEGPVPAGLDDRALARARARFLAGEGWTDEATAIADLAERDGRFEAALGAEELVLWFEWDLHDQLQLVQVLERIGRAATRPGRLTIVLTGSFAELEPHHWVDLHRRRSYVPASAIELAARAWAAFAAPEPLGLEALLADDTGAIPPLGEALRRLLEELPSTVDGLSRSERQLLEAVAAGAPDLRTAFVESHHEREEPVFLGDTVFASHCRRLSAGPAPLLLLDDGARIVTPAAGGDWRGFWTRRAAITADGLAVLEGRADAVACLGLDRWLGGTHLTTASHFRWDHVAGSVRRAGLA